jgi:7-carboxy-7-deazaguanine synthase
MEDFLTLQGEGSFQGTLAYFIRLGGCDVGCVWCDVKESWPAEAHPQVDPEAIVERAKRSGAPIAVITGGEPTMYNLEILTSALQKAKIRTHIETSGAYPITGVWDWICLSPKKFKSPDSFSYGLANELKVIVFHPSDLAWAEKEGDKVNASCRLFLQPEWSKEKEMVPLIIDYIRKNPRWRISLQIHKYLNIP